MISETAQSSNLEHTTSEDSSQGSSYKFGRLTSVQTEQTSTEDIILISSKSDSGMSLELNSSKSNIREDPFDTILKSKNDKKTSDHNYTFENVVEGDSASSIHVIVKTNNTPRRKSKSKFTKNIDSDSSSMAKKIWTTEKLKNLRTYSKMKKLPNATKNLQNLKTYSKKKELPAATINLQERIRQWLSSLTGIQFSEFVQPTENDSTTQRSKSTSPYKSNINLSSHQKNKKHRSFNDAPYISNKLKTNQELQKHELELINQIDNKFKKNNWSRIRKEFRTPVLEKLNITVQTARKVNRNKSIDPVDARKKNPIVLLQRFDSDFYCPMKVNKTIGAIKRKKSNQAIQDKENPKPVKYIDQSTNTNLMLADQSIKPLEIDKIPAKSHGLMTNIKTIDKSTNTDQLLTNQTEDLKQFCNKCTSTILECNQCCQLITTNLITIPTENCSKQKDPSNNGNDEINLLDDSMSTFMLDIPCLLECHQTQTKLSSADIKLLNEKTNSPQSGKAKKRVTSFETINKGQILSTKNLQTDVIGNKKRRLNKSKLKLKNTQNSEHGSDISNFMKELCQNMNDTFDITLVNDNDIIESTQENKIKKASKRHRIISSASSEILETNPTPKKSRLKALQTNTQRTKSSFDEKLISPPFKFVNSSSNNMNNLSSVPEIMVLKNIENHNSTSIDSSTLAAKPLTFDKIKSRISRPRTKTSRFSLRKKTQVEVGAEICLTSKDKLHNSPTTSTNRSENSGSSLKTQVNQQSNNKANNSQKSNENNSEKNNENNSQKNKENNSQKNNENNSQKNKENNSQKNKENNSQKNKENNSQKNNENNSQKNKENNSQKNKENNSQKNIENNSRKNNENNSQKNKESNSQKNIGNNSQKRVLRNTSKLPLTMSSQKSSRLSVKSQLDSSDTLELMQTPNTEQFYHPVAASTPLRSQKQIMCTLLQADQIVQLKRFSKRFNIIFSTVDNSSITHLVTKADDDNSIADVTIKIVSAIARGIWILSFQWILDCLKKNKLLPEEPYELLDMNCGTGPKNSRLCERPSMLFKPFNFCILSGSCPIDKLKFLIEQNGGCVFPDVITLSKQRTGIPLIIAKPNDLQQGEAQGFYQEYGIISIMDSWIFDTIVSFKINSIYSHLIENLSNRPPEIYPLELFLDSQLSAESQSD